MISERLAAAAQAATDGVNAASLHLGDPGVGGTANRSAVPDVAVTIANNGATSTVVAVFTIDAAGGPFTHVALWAGGSFVDAVPLQPAEQFTDEGELTATLTVTAETGT